MISISTQLLTPNNLKTCTFKLSGLNEYLEKIQKAGNNVEKACKEAVHESAKPIYDDVEKWAKKHKFTGTVLKGVNMTDTKQDGSYISVDVGIDSNIEYNAWHAVFVEYGAPTTAADPGIRGAFFHNRNRVKKIQREILQKEGMPID